MKALVEKRVALITGVAERIGTAIADRLERAGAVCVHADFIEASSITHKLSVTRISEWRATLIAVVEQHGKIEILVNNACIAGSTHFSWEVPQQEWDHVIAGDLSGTFFGCQAVLPRMRWQQYGRIVNIASIAGREGNPRAAPYVASKAGVIGLSKATAEEVCTEGILVNCVTPAVIDAPILQQVAGDFRRYVVSCIPMERVGRPEEVAALVTWLASEQCSFSTVAGFDISGGRATH